MDAAGTAGLELPVVMHIASLPTRKALGILFIYIYIYEYMHVFIFQYINVTEMIETKNKYCIRFAVAQKVTSCRS